MHVDNKIFEDMMDIIYYYDTSSAFKCFIQNYEHYSTNDKFDALLKIFVKKFVDRFLKLEPKERDLRRVRRYLSNRINNYEKMNIYFAEELRNRASKDESKKDVLSAILNTMLHKLINIPIEEFKKQNRSLFLLNFRYFLVTDIFNFISKVVENDQIVRRNKEYEFWKQGVRKTVSILRKLGLNDSQILKMFTEPSLAWAKDFLDKELVDRAEKNVLDGRIIKKAVGRCAEFFGYPEVLSYKNFGDMYDGLIKSGVNASDLWLFFLENAFRRNYMTNYLIKSEMEKEAFDIVEFVVEKSGKID